jgi:hypothetical protein
MGMDWIDEKGAEAVARVGDARYRDGGTLGRAADRLLEVARAARDTVAAYRSADGDALVLALDRLAELLDYDPRPRRAGDAAGDPP